MKFAEVEEARKTYWQKLKTGLIISVAISVVPILLFMLSKASVDLALFFVPFFIAFFCMVVVLVITRKSANAYHKAYKGYFVEQSLKKTFTDLEYDHRAGLSSSLLKSTGMINTAERYSSNDYVSAKYKKVGFTGADAKIERIQYDSDGNANYYPIFKGRIMIFEFPKKFNFKLELIGKRFIAYNIPKKDSKTGRKMTKISTESGEFNRTFKVFAQDGFETFYILDPARIVKIQSAAERYKNKILFGFFDNKMLVAIDDGKDSFEPPKPWKAIDEKVEAAKIAGDIKVITDLVDELSLAPIFS